MYESIVVGTDGSSTARGAVAEAVRLAAAVGARVHLVSAYQAPSMTMAAASMGMPGMGALPDEWEVSARDVVDANLEQAATEVRAHGIKVETYAVPGNPVSAILEIASATRCDLIVVGSRGMSGARRVLGSVPNSVAHKADCHVLIVKTC